MENVNTALILEFAEHNYTTMSEKIAHLDGQIDDLLNELADTRHRWAEETPDQGWPIEYIARAPTVASVKARLRAKEAELDGAIEALKTWVRDNRDTVMMFYPECPELAE